MEVEALARQWGFIPTEQLDGGHCSRVFADATRALKAPFRGEELTFGVRAAVRLAEAGGPAIEAVDEASGAILMERLRPGTPLSDLGLGPEGVEAFVELATKCWSLDGAGMLPVRDYVIRRSELLDRLDASAPRVCFLHGDLHHWNILRDGEAWRPIDAKGLVGDPHYELVSYLRNPVTLLNVPGLLELTRRRLLEACERLDLEPWRVAAWALCDHESDPDEPEPWQRFTAVYATLEAEFRI